VTSRTLVWRRVDAPGMEVAHVESLERASGTQIGVTYELRGGRIWRVRLYLGHERALQAAAEGSPA